MTKPDSAGTNSPSDFALTVTCPSNSDRTASRPADAGVLFPDGVDSVDAVDVASVVMDSTVAGAWVDSAGAEVGLEVQAPSHNDKRRSEAVILFKSFTFQ